MKTYQDVFNALSHLESILYYMCDERDHMNTALEEIHDKLYFCVKAWSEYTGCTNDTDDTREVE